MSTWPHCQAAHEAQVSKGNVILDDFQPGSNSVRDERDKPFDPFGVTKEQEGQIPTIAPTVSQLHLPLTRDKGNGDWVGNTRYLHSFFLFILPLILFSDKYLLIFFYLILSYLQKKIWLKEIFHIFYSSKRIFYNEQWNSTDISLVFKSVSKYSCLVIIPSCRHQSQSRIFSLQISGCRVHTTHTCSSLPDAESSRLLRISSGKARLKLRSPYTETPGPCWKACICECTEHREWPGLKVFISSYQLLPAWSTFQLIYNLNS